MFEQHHTLAERLGTTTHVSPLRYKLKAAREQSPSVGTNSLEEWLVDVANQRGFRIIRRPRDIDAGFTPPGENVLSNEDLVVAVCQLQCMDQPQFLRLAAQIISRKSVDLHKLILAAKRERTTRVLAELARQALRVDPEHELWKQIHESFSNARLFAEPLLHWSRLAEPVMKDNRYNAEEWKLVT